MTLPVAKKYYCCPENNTGCYGNRAGNPPDIEKALLMKLVENAAYR